MVGNELYINEKYGYFECIVEEFPLTYGEFNIRIVINVENETADWIENGLTFFVHDSDFFNTGSKNAQGRQGVYLHHKWV